VADPGVKVEPVGAGGGQGQGADSQGQDQTPGQSQVVAGSATDAAAPSPVQAQTQPDAATVAAGVQPQLAATTSPATLPTSDAKTVSELSARIIQTATGGKSSFEMTLHPEGLGDVRVKVSVDRNGAVTANMSFSNAAAAADLSGRVNDLKDSLTQAGFTVADNGLNFNLGGDPSSGGQSAWTNANPNAGRMFQTAAGASEDILASVNQAAANLQRPAAAGLNLLI
jgi:hypothetical protein